MMIVMMRTWSLILGWGQPSLQIYVYRNNIYIYIYFYIDMYIYIYVHILVDVFNVILYRFYCGIHHHSITIWDMFLQELVPNIETATVL